MNSCEPRAEECSTIEFRVDKGNERDNDEVMKLIDCFQHYLIAEQLMSLRDPDTNELNQTLDKIDQLYIDLVSNLSDSRATLWSLLLRLKTRLSSIFVKAIGWQNILKLVPASIFLGNLAPLLLTLKTLVIVSLYCRLKIF